MVQASGALAGGSGGGSGSLAEIVAGSPLDPCVRALAVVLGGAGDAALRLAVDAGLVAPLVGVVTLACAGGAAGLRALSSAAGNATKCLIDATGGGDAARCERVRQEVVALNGVAGLLELLKLAPDGPVRKNAAIVLARLARHPETLEALRAMRGMEILMDVSRSMKL